MGQVLPGLRTIALKPRGVKAGGIGTSASTSAWRLQALHERGDEIRDEAIVGGGIGYLAGELPVERPLQARTKQERRGGLQAGTGADTAKALFEPQIADQALVGPMRPQILVAQAVSEVGCRQHRGSQRHHLDIEWQRQAG